MIPSEGEQWGRDEIYPDSICAFSIFNIFISSSLALELMPDMVWSAGLMISSREGSSG